MKRAFATVDVQMVERPATSGPGLAEAIYRWVDSRLFHPPLLPPPVAHAVAESVASSTHTDVVFLVAPDAEIAGRCWSVTYEGLSADQLEEAVRRRLGQTQGTVEAAVHLHVDGEARCVFTARCALDHRSLGRSVQWVAAKLPSLLRAAVAREGAPQALTPDASLAAAAPLTPSRMLWRLLRHAARRLWAREQWYLRLHASMEESNCKLGAPLATIEPPADAFWADPFLASYGGRLWLLFESLPFEDHKAHLRALEIDASGAARGDSREVLAEPWHLSYPFVLAEGGGCYMIPESSAHGSVDLYRCVQWPHRWERVAELLSGGRYADATITRYQGRLWMFVSYAEPGGSLYDELHLFWAERLEGPWHPHRLNPVKIDATGARPAGAMWIQEGQLHRPVQDCSDVYGGAVRVQRIMQLDEQQFAEAEVARLAVPGLPEGACVHTFNRYDDMVAVDVLRLVPRLRSWWAAGARILASRDSQRTRAALKS